MSFSSCFWQLWRLREVEAGFELGLVGRYKGERESLGQREKSLGKRTWTLWGKLKVQLGDNPLFYCKSN